MLFLHFNKVSEFLEELESHDAGPNAVMHATAVYRRSKELPLYAMFLLCQFKRYADIIVELVVDCGNQMNGQPDKVTVSKFHDARDQVEKWCKLKNVPIQGGRYSTLSALDNPKG